MAQLTPVPSDVFALARPGTRAAVHLLRGFAARGVRAAFGIPGSSISPLFDALADVPQIELVTTRHETTAVFAAIGHARATGLPALVLVTSGPGVTNTLTGIASAHLEDVPLIVLGGDVATSWASRGAFQDSSPGGLDVVSLMRGVTRFTASVLAPSMAHGAVARAWACATGPRPGPVFLSVPYDVAQTCAEPIDIVDAPAHAIAAPDEGACNAAATMLSRAQRPLIVLGHGARGATDAAIQLAEKADSPVVVTPHAKGVFPETHPLYLGLIGNAGHPSAYEYVASKPDVVCVVGSRLGDFATNGWRLLVGGRVATIQIDRDPLLIGRNAPVTLGIVGDARMTLESIAANLGDASSSARKTPHLRTQPWSANAPAGTVKPQHAVLALERAFSGATFCSDIGEHMGFAQHYLTIDSPKRFHCMVGFGSMGSGLGAAIGIKHATPEERVLVFVGDGGFNMHVSELMTCVEENIGVVFAVFNDGCWNMVEHGFRAVFRRRPAGMPSHVANLADVARGYGADAFVIDDPDKLDTTYLRSLARPGVPLVLDIRIDRTESLSVGTRSG